LNAPMGSLPILFELSGEHPTLPTAEALACLRAEAPGFHQIGSGPGYLIVKGDAGRMGRAVDRLALTHRAGRHLGSCGLDALERTAAGLDLPPGSVCVRVRAVQGLYPEVDTYALARKVGNALSSAHAIDLTSPAMYVRVLLSDEAHLFLVEREIDRRSFEQRKVAERPFLSPISLHPRYARALINLTEARAGDRLLDPFCGTGGIVIEAALMGMKAIGSDIDPAMVDGCRRNLRHFGLEAEVEVADVGDVPEMFGEVAAVATDPPYGRAASTRKEDLDTLYSRGMRSMARTLAPGGRAGVVLPIEAGAEGLELQELHRQRVHRSLTRHYHVFIRR